MSGVARGIALAAIGGLMLVPGPAPAAGIAVRDTFRIGSAGVLCTAQARPLDPVLKGMFDRGYGITCRDAAAAVGNLYALRGTGGDALATILAGRPGKLECRPPAPVQIEGLGAVAMTACTGAESRVTYRGYAVTRGRTTFLADGLGGYDSALRLGLRTIVADAPVTGAVEVATTEAGDPAAFARVQAGALDPDAALAQAYERNNAGSFAESAEFFETLVERGAGGANAGRSGEYLIGTGIQQSNLGNFAAADRLFAQAEQGGATRDPIAGRLLRNYRAIHQLNQRRAEAALTALDTPVMALDGSGADQSIASGVISPPLADQINRQNAAMERLGGIDRRLRPAERAAILDGQAAQLRGVALRLQGRYPQALAALQQASRMLAAVREGRVASTAFMRSEGYAEMALIGEAQRDYAGAERDFTQASRILDTDYPQSAGALAARARLAAFLARRGEAERALALYGEVVAESQRLPGSAATMRSLIGPYFALLAPRVDGDPKAAAAMFAASQILVRPGVAQTQAVFARELSGGDDEASTLFRQSVTLSRDVARATGEVARLAAADPAPASKEASALAEARARLAATEAEQTTIQSRLAEYPRYRVLAPTALTLDELQKALKPGEAYYLMRVIGQDVYAMFVTPTAARAAKVATTTRALEEDVAKLRASIVTIENGVPQTYPFDLPLARKLYLALFEPFGAGLTATKNLVFEPDGPMLQLPPTLLVTEQAGVDAYAARLAKPKADAFDFRGVAWLGRDRDVTTAVSPRSFVDVRAIAPSRGTLAYLGLGHNAIPSRAARLLQAAAATGPASECDWPPEVWKNPIQPTELMLASQIIGKARSEVLTDAAFTDTALKARTDLNRYRVLHFATHGLVTAPRPQCPARPALVTSFGDAESDGLLSFREIYDLRLDADLIVLSACDTAGMATIDATREAGITTGGNFALDGLVRAFVGAGARSVIASHWPIPDDYDATKRLMRSLFTAPPGTPIAQALRTGQRALMEGVETSHPFYWAAFAIIGDGERPVVRQ
ncbi:CHAT domain-containing protein [Sphingomonas profundi]|uniref:CHAT domain-containing protein n=1 Tax=Alterirhizorhabdus profundi TaxID=2681549 RepID=UPI0012E98413|nr:CHAT domain-containing protein [Sphingomonas profundi]